MLAHSLGLIAAVAQSLQGALGWGKRLAWAGQQEEPMSCGRPY